MSVKNPGKRKSNRVGMFLAIVLIIVFAVVLGVRILQIKEKRDELQYSIKRMQESVSQAEEYLAALKDWKERGLSEKEIEELARERFGLVYDDEIIFVPEE